MRLNYGVAEARFRAALDLARSGRELPIEWLEHTRRIGESPSKTFVAMLGTALLAKATDASVDPFALKVRDYTNAYSARSLCKDVLVPAAVKAGISLGTTGREPLNNQPFFRYERVSQDMAVLGPARPFLNYLLSCLRELEELPEDASLLALAAFLRVRLQQPVALGPRQEGTPVIGLAGLVEVMAAFVARDPEGGRRGQAFVAACLDLVFPDVRTRRINDPSRHWPGDVVVFSIETITLASEVKQRPATDTEILQFVEGLGRRGVERALVVALDPKQPSLAIEDLRQVAWDRHQVHLMVFEDPRELLLAALTWSADSLRLTLSRFPSLVARRLEELEVSAGGIAEWSAIFETPEVE